MRVVLDTNVLVSAWVFPGGAPEEVLRLSLDRRIQAVTSPSLLAELSRVLRDKFEWSPDRVQQAIHLLVSALITVRPSEKLAVVAADPTDDRVLEAVLEGEADLVVSGDRHLRKLGAWEGIRILDPSSFLEETTPR